MSIMHISCSKLVIIRNNEMNALWTYFKVEKEVTMLLRLIVSIILKTNESRLDLLLDMNQSVIL
jgi:hypothetical protein